MQLTGLEDRERENDELLLAIGLITRLVSLLFVVEMFVAAIFLVTSNVAYIAAPGQGAGVELPVLMLAASWTLFILGPGEPSVDRNLLGWDGLEGRFASRFRHRGR